jgi:predicted phage gp36 major capsid-like protein
MNQELALLRVLLNVKTAQMALMMDEVADAEERLENSREDLDRVSQGMTGAEAEVLRDLINRLDLIQSEIDRDPEAAAQDLEILANTLVTLERAISTR